MAAKSTKAADDKPKLSLEELAAQYGYAAAFFNSDPELANLIKQAVSGQWTPDKFRAALMASNWYRARTESSRAWIELQGRDPQEAAKRVAEKARAIQAMANQQGISIGQDRLNKMAVDALSMGWDDTLLQQTVAAEWQYKPGEITGGAATLEVRVKQLADEYGVSLSQSQIGDFISGSMAGRYTEDNIADFMRDTARSKYPGLQGYLDVGMTVKQVAAPYLQSYANILEVGGDTISVNDPAIQRALQGQMPVKSVSPRAPQGSMGTLGMQTGAPTTIGGQTAKPGGPSPVMPVQPQSLYDFERDLRKDPRWLQTKNAKDSIQNSAIGILRDFGIYG